MAQQRLVGDLIAISSGRTEASETSEISGSAASSSRACSARRFSVRSSASPEMAIESTCRGNSACATVGRSASSGQLSMASTRARISAMRRDTSSPECSSIETLATPSAAVARMRFTPERPCTASSMRVASASSTSPGEAPG